jgi:hypothetical protein
MVTVILPPCLVAQFPSGPIILNAQNGTIIDNLKVTSTTGDCVTINGSSNVIIRNSEIGPCKGNGIVVSGTSVISVFDSYIHPEAVLPATCCDHGSGIVFSKSTNVKVQGNVIAYGESNIVLLNSIGANITGNFLLNPRNTTSRGHNVMVSDGSSGVLIDSNYTLASSDTNKYKYAAKQEDSLNIQSSSAATVQYNYVAGGTSPSGCGIIADYAANNAQFLSNSLVDTGQCGIGIAAGIGHIVDGNRIINSTPVPNGGNTAIYVWLSDPSGGPCSTVSITNNIASQIKPDGSESGFWNGGGCEPVTLSGNTFDGAARSLLLPVAQKLPPPLIPPRPYACVATSPFSNQTSVLGCNSQGSNTTTLTGPLPDNFNGDPLNTNVWSFVNPTGDGSYSMNGSQLRLTVPAGSNHDPTLGGVDNAVRVIQAASNSSNFTVEVKFDSIPTLQYQFEGIVIEQDPANFLLFQFGSTGSSLVANAAKVSSADVTTVVGGEILIPNGTTSLWMRVQKAGTTWTQSWSADGVNYTAAGSFTQALTVTGLGPFAGNYNRTIGAAPAFTASIDYFSNITSPQTGSAIISSLAHVASGGGWKTTVNLQNISSARNMVTVSFFADDGNPLTLPFTITQQGSTIVSTGSSLNAAIDPSATILIETEASAGGPISVGWAQVASSVPISGFAIFRQHLNGQDAEGTTPLETRSLSDLILPYDNTAGFATGAAFVNAVNTAITLNAVIRDDSGVQLAVQSIPLNAMGHIAFLVGTQFPATSGRRGLIEFQNPSGSNIAALGLRFSPAFSFTSIPITVRQ